MTTDAAARRQFVTFEAAGELMAADIFSVERVLRYEPPRLLPNSAAWLRGVIAHGGAAIPVVDLRERLGLPAAAPGEQTRILVMVVGEERIGLVVDAVRAVRTVEAADIELPPAIYRGLSRDYLEGIVRQGDALCIVLAAARILTTTERLEMARAMAPEARDG
jgi:purine-binding chemotaxis protein CheW